jgi:hypothetical protein
MTGNKYTIICDMHQCKFTMDVPSSILVDVQSLQWYILVVSGEYIMVCWLYTDGSGWIMVYWCKPMIYFSYKCLRRNLLRGPNEANSITKRIGSPTHIPRDTIYNIK